MYQHVEKYMILKEAIKTNTLISSMRIGFLGCLIVAWIVAILGIILDRELLGLAAIITSTYPGDGRESISIKR